MPPKQPPDVQIGQVGVDANVAVKSLRDALDANALVRQQFTVQLSRGCGTPAISDLFELVEFNTNQ